MPPTFASIAILGLGAMGSALATRLVDAGYQVTAWNRTPGRAEQLASRVVVEAPSAKDAVLRADVIVVCLYDTESVYQTLRPLAGELEARSVVNLTSTTPAEARELAHWAGEHSAGYLDGAIMATPDMIGSPGAAIFYSGSQQVFDAHRALFDTWAISTYDGDDAGMASLFDLAMLSGMYTMFAGFVHGAAMVRASGVSTAQYAERATPFLAAMTDSFSDIAKTVDSGEYDTPGQSLDWTSPVLDAISRASREQSVDPAPIDMVRLLAQRQIDAGHGADDYDRIIESL